MIAAAQAAAEAALREAVAREATSNNDGGMGGVKQQQHHMMGQPQPGDHASSFAQQQQQQQLAQQEVKSPEMELLAANGMMGNIPQTEAEMMLGAAGNQSSATQGELFGLLYQQEQQQEQQVTAQDDNGMGANAMMAESPGDRRPKEHYLTITKDGTIVEASNTVIGFPPEALLMTSTYDTLFDEDLPGFLCVKSQFWDKQQMEVEVFIRRRSIEGDWVWLVSKAVSFMTHPIQGVMLVERVVDDEQMAQKFNRITRITAIVVQAAEASRLTDPNTQISTEEGETPYEDESQSLMKESAEIESLLRRLQDNGTLAISDNNDMHQLLEIASTQGKGHNNADGLSGGNNNNNNGINDNDEKNTKRKKGFDPNQMIEIVRQGVRLDLGLTRLEIEEVKLLSMVLTGELDVEAVAPLVLESLQTGFGLAKVFEWAEALKAMKAEEAGRGKGGFNMMQQQQQQQQQQSWSNGAQQQKPTNPNWSELYPPPPPISVVNLSYAYIGNNGMEVFAESLFVEGTGLKTLDVSFCGIDEKGFLAMAKALSKRKKKGIDPLRCLMLSGNHISPRAGSELGAALAASTSNFGRKGRKKSRGPVRSTGGYDTDSSDDEEDDDDDFDTSSSWSARKQKQKRQTEKEGASAVHKDAGIQVLHLASTSLKPDALGRLLEGLGPHSSLRELNLSSNALKAAGAGVLARCLEVSGDRIRGGQVPLPFLDRVDVSDNNFCDSGATALTKMISNRSKVHIIDLRLSSNSISAIGIEKIMNKLLSHNLISLSLDKNAIGDQGCQLVAASLQSMKSLGRLNLNFNQIGSRGINSLMRSLIACESVTFLGLSGNILKISGAMALAFTLAQHPRLEEVHLDNCCLGQAAQCHIVAGIISNRWVPMKRLAGYAVGPPMVAIGALKPYAQNFGNDECFRIRKDEQMKTILQWMESHRGSKSANNMDASVLTALGGDSSDQRFLTPEFVSNINDVHGIPSQNAYFRLLGWLSSIPFDDDELTVLQKYFYDVDGGDGDRGSDGYINLKLRGDLLAALDSEVAEEMHNVFPSLSEQISGSVGIKLDKLFNSPHSSGWEVMKGEWFESEFSGNYRTEENEPSMQNESQDSGPEQMNDPGEDPLSDQQPVKDKKPNRAKPRITMFPKFEQQLEQLKSAAAEMIEQEEDPMHHEVILTQYAEASLTILRQLRYHCMNSGLDGWRQGGLKRKVLVVDDSRITRRLVSRAFENANFIVDTASNGAEGVEKMKASIYDIAFMDIDMPVMNGFEATKKLREWEDTTRPGARQPICALTAAYVDDFERSELMKFKDAGLDVMESKPCNMPRLFKVVDDVSPMFSDLSLNLTQRERSDGRMSN